jgi:hypothetical protein
MSRSGASPAHDSRGSRRSPRRRLRQRADPDLDQLDAASGAHREPRAPLAVRSGRGRPARESRHRPRPAWPSRWRFPRGVGSTISTRRSPTFAHQHRAEREDQRDSRPRPRVSGPPSLVNRPKLRRPRPPPGEQSGDGRPCPRRRPGKSERGHEKALSRALAVPASASRRFGARGDRHHATLTALHPSTLERA